MVYQFLSWQHRQSWVLQYCWLTVLKSVFLFGSRNTGLYCSILCRIPPSCNRDMFSASAIIIVITFTFIFRQGAVYTLTALANSLSFPYSSITAFHNHPHPHLPIWDHTRTFIDADELCIPLTVLIAPHHFHFQIENSVLLAALTPYRQQTCADLAYALH